MLIGILQCGHFAVVEGFPKRTYTDLYSAMLNGHGFTHRTWSVVDMEFPGSVRDADGWLISGSKHGAYEDLPFIPPLEDFVREVYAAEVPMVGICFGHQIMAQALGGRVEKWQGGWSIGRVGYDFGGETLALNAWHQDQVVAVPDEAEVTASSDACAIAGLRYARKAMSVQPHPEFDAGAVDLLLEARARGVVPDSMIATAREANALPVANGEMARRIAEFFKESRNG